MTHIDTSALVASLSEGGDLLPALRRRIAAGDVMRLSVLVLYEWRRGPRTAAQLAVQRRLFPDELAVPMEPEDAMLAAELYRKLGRARARASDIAIAAMAIRQDAALWTLNRDDFADVPGLRLASD